MQESQLAERSTRANYLLNKIEETYADLLEHDRFKNEKVKHLSEYYLELVKMGWLEVSKEDIAKTIIKRFAENGTDISPSTVYQCVSEECRPREYSTLKEFLRSQGLINKDNDSEIGIATVKYKPLNELTPAELQQEVEELKPSLEQINEEKRRKQERFNELLERANREKIALTIPVKQESIRTVDGVGKETEGWRALGEHIETLQGVRDTYYEYPLPEEEDKELAKGIRDYNEIFKPYSDLKYSKSFPEWQQVQITNEHSGKHAAAVKHGVTLPDGTKRNLTREQVGDSAEEILTKSYNALVAIPIIGRLTSWHKKKLEPVVAQRKADLSPVLSDKA